MFNRQAATVGCLFVILSEWHLYHSQIARFYSGVFLFGALSYLFYYLSIRKESYIYLSLFFISSILAMSFHATSVFVIISCGAYSLFLMVYTRSGNVDVSIDIARVHILICLLIALVVSPKLIGIIDVWGINYRGLNIDGIHTMMGVVENIGIVIFISSFLGLLYLYFKNKQKSYLFSFLVFIPLASVFLFSIFLPPSRPRYLFYSTPLLFALSSFLCVGMKNGIDFKIVNDSVSIIISSVLLVGFISYYSGRISLDIKDPIEFVEEKYRSEDKVIVFGPSAMYNFDDEVDVNMIASKSVWKGELVPIANKEGRTWIIVDTYRTSALRKDLESWLMENTSLKWRKEETRFDYTQRGYEVWLEDEQ